MQKVHNISNIAQNGAKMSSTANFTQKGKTTRQKEKHNTDDFRAVLGEVWKERTNK